MYTKMLTYILWKVLIIVFAFESSQGVVRFTTQPVNASTNYGEFVSFECRIQVVSESHLLVCYIGSTTVQNARATFNFDEREFSANVSNRTACSVWMLVNNRTLKLFNSFWCRVYHGFHQHLESDVAYVHVQYPECSTRTSTQDPQSQTSTTTLTESVSTANYSMTSTPALESHPTCSCDPVVSNGELRIVDDHQATVFYYKIGFGVCCSLMLLMLLALLVIAVRMCIIHRRKIHEKSSLNSASRICNSLVRNPIYDGPVYESVLPRLETPTKKAQNPTPELDVVLTTHSSSTGDSSDHDQTSLLDDFNDGSRYVCKPRRMSVPILHSGVPLPYITPRESRQSRNSYRKALGLTSRGNYKPDVSTSRVTSDRKDSKEMAINTSFKEKEDPYTLMSPAGTLAASLTGGWGEFSHKLNNE